MMEMLHQLTQYQDDPSFQNKLGFVDLLGILPTCSFNKICFFCASAAARYVILVTEIMSWFVVVFT